MNPHPSQNDAETLLRESEARYRTLFNSINEGFCVIELLDGPHGPLSDYIHVEGNPALERHAGLANIVGRKIRDLAPDEAGGWVQLYREVLLTGAPFRFERTFVQTGRHLELSAFRVEPASRRQVAVLFRDVTARKLAEKSMRESEERFRTVANSAPVLIWQTDSSGVMFVNRYYLDYFGVPFEEVAGMGWSKFLHPEDANAYLNAYREGWKREISYEFQCRFLRADGKYRWLHNVGSAHRNPDGAFQGFVGCSVDVSDIKRAEEVLHSEAKRLEVLVADRTANLQAAVGELEAFSYSVAHDLRAPLRALSGYSKALAKESSLSAEGKDFVLRIERAATRMDRLTQEVLTYSQLGRSEIALRPVDLDKLTHQLVEEYPHLAAHKQHIHIESPLTPVCAHEPLLSQALTNLLSNACKFIQHGAHPEVTVRTEPLDGEVRIWVEDKGIGIAPEHKSRLFKLFGRIHPESKFPGTGVGLAIVLKAAQRMKGTTGVESEEGKGSRFWLQLKKA